MAVSNGNISEVSLRFGDVNNSNTVNCLLFVAYVYLLAQETAQKRPKIQRDLQQYQ